MTTTIDRSSPERGPSRALASQFNTENLLHPNVFFAGRDREKDRVYTEAEYEEKVPRANRLAGPTLRWPSVSGFTVSPGFL